MYPTIPHIAGSSIRWFVVATSRATVVPPAGSPNPGHPRRASVSLAQPRTAEDVARMKNSPAGSDPPRRGDRLPGAAALGPPLLGHLVSPPDGQRARRDVLGDDRAGADVGVVPDGERRDQARV